MMQWINRAAHPEIKPPTRRPLMCFCPEWCETGYQVAVFDGNKFTYNEEPNDMFDETVTDWSIFIEAD